METLEIVFGNSCYMTMKNSAFKNNNILLFNALLNVGDLSSIREYRINIPDELCNECSNFFFEDEILVINDSIKRKAKIRIWTSHYNVYSYLIMLYICDILKNVECELYVTYSSDFTKLKEGKSNSDDIIRNWLRNRITLEFLETWESIYNPDFNSVEFDGFRKSAGLHTFTLSVSEWCEKTNAIGIYSKRGKYGVHMRIKI